jgi:Tol biopolymer transport system component
MTEDISNKIRQVGKKLWFYGWGRQRFRCGLIDWRLGNRGGIKEWYNYTSGTPFNPVDGICFDCWNDAPPFMGPNGPISTLGMEETTQGRIDFFYIVTLEKWIERAKQKKNLLTAKALRQAEAIIADLKKKIVPDYFYYYKRMKASGYKANQFDISKEDVFKWKDDEYQIYRRKIADAIVALKNAIAGIEPAVVTTAHNAAVTQAATEKPGAFTTAPDGALILTVDDFTDAEPAWSPDGNIVSYVSKRSDGNKIILGRLNSKSTVILPDSIMPDTSYSWSPKADQIAFIAVDGVVKVVSLKNNRVIPLGKGKNPVFSPDGQKLAYFSAAGVMVYDFSSVKTSDLSQSSKEEALEKLCWSNDGKSIYYSKDGDIWAVSVTGTNNQRLLDHSRTNLNIGPALENPVAAPDGKMLYLTLNYDGLFAHASNNQLAVYRFADNKLTPICDANSWSLSPDGKKIIYGVGDHLISYDTVSARKTELFKGTDPAFSPDGKRIAYLYRQSLLEEPEVRIADLP